MAKYHINSKGEPGLCRAEAGKCPFGGDASHYPTRENAQKAYELSNAGQAMPEAASKEPAELKSPHIVRKGRQLRPTEAIEQEVNRWPSCYTERANNALRHGVATLYEYVAEKPRTVQEFEGKAQELRDRLSKRYLDDGITDSEPRHYWNDHMDKMREDNGWAKPEW